MEILCRSRVHACIHHLISPIGDSIVARFVAFVFQINCERNKKVSFFHFVRASIHGCCRFLRSHKMTQTRNKTSRARNVKQSNGALRFYVWAIKARPTRTRTCTAYMRPATNHRVPSFSSFFVCIATQTHICRITHMWTEVYRRAHRLEFRCSMPLSRLHTFEKYSANGRVSDDFERLISMNPIDRHHPPKK